MRYAAFLFVLLAASSAPAQKQLAHSPRILDAKTVFFLNTTGSDAVGSEALAQLKKWGKYQIVSDRSHADLIFLLSADPYHGGDVLLNAESELSFFEYPKSPGLCA